MSTVVLLAALALSSFYVSDLVLYLATKEAPGKTPGAGEKK